MASGQIFSASFSCGTLKTGFVLDSDHSFPDWSVGFVTTVYANILSQRFYVYVVDETFSYHHNKL